ncbi:Cytoskeleton-associated protein and related proteins [Phaffia rhodozyma]|uniref:Cytoskeleton-associated protein and related proteins n=1 Tax=Phaffia rhodozyma TaxID=264483 RepID=A0A0F7SIV1_PHARH|nr:Cytoskeleton-associated protein and related proteins [Phaffia rhodozyma]
MSSHLTPRPSRLSGIPTPGRVSLGGSGLPTPSNRKVSLPPPLPNQSYQASEDKTLSRALSDAIRHNPPPGSSRNAPSEDTISSPGSQSFFNSNTNSSSISGASLTQTPRRPSSSASSNRSYMGSSSVALPLPRTPGPPALRSTGFPSTPTPGTSGMAARAGPRKSLLASSTPRMESRHEARPGSSLGTAVGGKGPAAGFNVGDRVRIDSMGMEGLLAYVGKIDGKPGIWAGVELSGGFAGKGKNNGTVGEKQYFTCPENCGVFLQHSKLSAPTTTGAHPPRPSSVASTRSSIRTGSESGRYTPSISGRSTPSVSGRATPSISGRATPSQSSRVLTAKRSEEEKELEGKVTAGSRASKYLGMTAKQLKDRSASDSDGKSDFLSRSTTTPRAVRTTGLGQPTPTRAASSRQSLGASSSSHITPGRLSRSITGGPSRSTPTSEMPPPPSPSKLKANLAASAATTSSVSHRPSSRQSDYPSGSSRSSSRMSDIGLRPMTPKSEAIVSLETTNTTLQDKIANLMRSSSRQSDHYPDSPGTGWGTQTTSPPTTRTTNSTVSMATPTGGKVEPRTEEAWIKQKTRIDQLLIRVDSLEKENLGLLLERQRSPEPSLHPSNNTSSQSTNKLASPGGGVDNAALMASLEARAINAERQVQAHTTRLTILESELSAAAQTARTSQTTIEQFEQTARQMEEDRAREQAEAKAGLKDLQSKLDDTEALVKGLKEAAEVKEEGQTQYGAEVQAKKKEIEILQSKVTRLGGELAQQKSELGAQIDALRRAGQETIMLYEERLNAAESMRLDMESFLRFKEEELARSNQRSASPTSSSQPSSRDPTQKVITAIEIDNENLIEQVTHLNRRIASFEEQIEEYQLQIESDEAAVRVKTDQALQVEKSLRKELAAARTQMEGLVKSERSARSGVTDIEEALRENHVALENARSEIEGLRAEIANLENSQGESPNLDRTDRVQEIEKKLATDRARFEEEIKQLKGMLEEIRASRGEALEAAASSRLELEQRTGEIEELKEAIDALEAMVEEKIMTEEDGLNREIASEKSTQDQSEQLIELRRALAESQAELEIQTQKHESEFNDLQSKVAEIDRRNQQEVQELENLIESKIYREDELEREIEDLKYKLSQPSKSSSSGTHSRNHTGEAQTKKLGSSASRNGDALETCELCDNPDHEIQDCPLFNGSSSATHYSPRSSNGEDTADSVGKSSLPSFKNSGLLAESTDNRPWCDDCETFGHPTEECEYAQEMF